RTDVRAELASARLVARHRRSAACRQHARPAPERRTCGAPGRQSVPAQCAFAVLGGDLAGEHERGKRTSARKRSGWRTENAGLRSSAKEINPFTLSVGPKGRSRRAEHAYGFRRHFDFARFASYAQHERFMFQLRHCRNWRSERLTAGVKMK